jgi:hypothetical protein
MAEEDFKEGLIKFGNMQRILSSILCPSIFRQIAAILMARSPLLCPINATSSFSYVFRLHYPRVLHCRIVPIQKLKTLFVLGRKKPPIIVVLSEFKRSNLKSRASSRKHLVGYITGRGEYFHETFVRHHSNLTNN